MTDLTETLPEPAASARNAVETRAELVHRLRRNLVGPSDFPHDDDLATERLPAGEGPSRWYLTGFIAPQGDAVAHPEAAAEEDADEEAEIGLLEPTGHGSGGAAGDDGEPEQPVVKRRFLPSSIGITAMLDPGTHAIEVEIAWGDYVPEPPLPPEVLSGDDDTKQTVDWRRVPRAERLTLIIPRSDEGMITKLVPSSGATARAGGALELGIRARPFTMTLPDGGTTRVRVVTVFLVNKRAEGTGRKYQDLTYAYQVRLALHCTPGFVAQHDLSRIARDDWDDRLADLHYRDAAAYAVGLGCATGHATDDDGVVRCVHTTAMPRASVERTVASTDVGDVELGIDALADLAAAGGEALAQRMRPLVTAYALWSSQQSHAAADAEIARAPQRRETAAILIAAQAEARKRIAAGIELLAADGKARLAFEIASRAIASAARKRRPEAPQWRPFQLAFVLLNLVGQADKTHPDREIVDLLFFPTGGGKTEAYLGLAAFTIAYRRLQAPGLLGAGVSVIMRYTLRLLTLDQLGRAAGVVCALELLRTGDSYLGPNGRRLLGDWPIEIGLWVGSDASPNRLGGTGNTGDDTAVTRVRQYKSGRDRRAPAPLKNCPWCGHSFEPQSFSCAPNMAAPTNLEIRCANIACDFTGDRPLPIVTVDEAIYRRLPAFMIATVDKFASLPWRGDAGAFFGHVDRADNTGFYGASRPRDGRPLDNGHRLEPPDLIIQDELHLISGPLGTVAGLYEAAVDRLATREIGGVRIRPKIVASTATVRRADKQIKALFDRSRTDIFPAPGIDRGNSFFAKTVPEAESPARWYVGLAAAGRGPKLVFLQALVTLLTGAQGLANEGAEADPYLTALCYFNALRELGGARRIVEDEVATRAATYGAGRRRSDPLDAPFGDRVLGEPIELTSRVSTDAVAAAKARLETLFSTEGGEPVDVALATNMISVGLDITRLGLMLVQGQPKTAAEYIQATSRVGRDHDRPGLVVAVLNVHKPRDRMHYEQFCHFHTTFYRAVEATSVTPWSARALDRALAAVVVAIARHIDSDLTPSSAVTALDRRPDIRSRVVDHLLARAPDDIVGGKVALKVLIQGLMDDWIEIAAEQTALGGSFSYETNPHRLLYAPLDPVIPDLGSPRDRFQAGWSMRDVEPGVLVKPRDPYGNPINGAPDL